MSILEGNKRVIIAHVGRPFSVHGWMTVHPESDHGQTILDYQPWQVETKEGWQMLSILESRPHGKYLIIQVPFVDTPEIARTYQGKKLSIFRNQLPALNTNEYYWVDLEGLTVVNQSDNHLGTIETLFRTGANDVIVVQGKKTHFIPFIRDEIIVHIDFENQLMRVNWDPLV